MLKAALLPAAGLLLYVTGYGLRFWVLSVLYSRGITDINYRGEPVATAGGLLVWLLAQLFLGGLMVWKLILGEGPPWDIVLFDMSLLLVTWASFADDRYGDKRIKGLSAHWNAWLSSGVPTTGWLKAGAVLGGALLVLPPDESLLGTVCGVLLPMLSANALNLLDLRPGRALKVFLVVSGALVLAAALCGEWFESDPRLLWLLPFIVGAMLLLPLDLKARVMLGDTGANLLGFGLGCAVLWSWGPAAEWGVLLVLILLHVWTWNRSLSQVIDGNAMLRWMDRLGRDGA
ncbi:hypothetical protein O9H85_10540 [Paenibacillus filicis]|uniref:Glycosyl transferase family 4 n=1 Tax=Paenibacillus gyeongsangnamensis TaxID=3388067 RepID=A0ABT4Q814_9BACL|nr:hypothetical protein [Paenibacillus filicis]MCZ8512845.1 hypothetical protein [Paenibacillus filicis]